MMLSSSYFRAFAVMRDRCFEKHVRVLDRHDSCISISGLRFRCSSIQVIVSEQYFMCFT